MRRRDFIAARQRGSLALTTPAQPSPMPVVGFQSAYPREEKMGCIQRVPAMITAAFIASAVFSSAGAADPTRKLMMEEFTINATDPGINLYVRNKRPEDMNHFTSEKTLLFVHGITLPSEATFDFPVEGLSWMDYIAQHGWDVYLVDVRGYGRSTRPQEMEQPAASNPPVVTTDVAVKDIGSAIDFILRRRGIAKLNLMGWSWGT
jgi:predicted alpha/beta-fold hydrolase